MQSIKIIVADNGRSENYHIVDEKFEYISCKEIPCLDNKEKTIKEEYLRELTAQYWAWKNCDEEVIGMMQYRRYLSCNDKLEELFYNEKFLKEDSNNEYGISSDRIMGIMSSFDIIEPKRIQLKGIGKFKSVKDYYLKDEEKYGTNHFELFCEKIGNKYPMLKKSLDSYLYSKSLCKYNIFIMKKECFLEYSTLLFDIIYALNDEIDKEYASYEQLKEYSNLSAILLAVYCDYKRETSKVKQLPIVEFDNVTCVEEHKPAFDNNNIALVLASSDFYTVYLSTMLSSIVTHSSEKYNYDITVLESSISEANKNLLIGIAKNKPNVSIRFYNVTRKMSGINLKAGGHISVETYYRLLIPEIFQAYSKVLFLDSDMTANHDVAELFMLDVEGYLVAAAHDQCIAAFCNGSDKTFIPYCKKVLKIDNYHDYFQAGVMLLNLDRFRAKYTQEEVFKVATSHQFRYVDQDIMNLLCRGEVKHFDLSWNCFPDFGDYDKIFMPNYLRLEYEEARKNPKICHHTGPVKPWDSLFADPMMSHMFWSNAQKSPFYEMISFRTMHSVNNQIYCDKQYNRKYKKVLRFIKNNVIVKFVGLFCPVGTKRRKKVKHLYCKMRGIEIPTWEMADE